MLDLKHPLTQYLTTNYLLTVAWFQEESLEVSFQIYMEELCPID